MRKRQNLTSIVGKKLGTKGQSCCHSNLEMSGAINATGVVETYEDGSEVAVWAFYSVNIGSEITVQLYDQRAMIIVSRSSLHIDTPFFVEPGTLGGFPGGFSASRHKNYRFQKVCDKANYFLFKIKQKESSRLSE